MAAEKLPFKDVPSVPNLKVAEFTASNGDKLQAFSMGPNVIHLGASFVDPSARH